MLKYCICQDDAAGIAKTNGRFVREWHINNGVLICECDGKYTLSLGGAEYKLGDALATSPHIIASHLHTEKVVSDVCIDRRRYVLSEYVLPWKVSFLGCCGPADGKNALAYFCSRRVGFFGAACSGKSVAARSFSNYLNVVLGVPADTPYEAATEWIQMNGIPDFQAQISIFHRQQRLEEAILRTGKVAVVDSPFPLTCIYARYYASKINKRHPVYFTMLEEAARGMDLYADQVYLPPRTWIDDGVRYKKNDDERRELDGLLVSWLHEHGSDCIWCSGEQELDLAGLGERFLRRRPLTDVLPLLTA